MTPSHKTISTTSAQADTTERLGREYATTKSEALATVARLQRQADDDGQVINAQQEWIARLCQHLAEARDDGSLAAGEVQRERSRADAAEGAVSHYQARCERLRAQLDALREALIDADNALAIVARAVSERKKRRALIVQIGVARDGLQEALNAEPNAQALCDAAKAEADDEQRDATDRAHLRAENERLRDRLAYIGGLVASGAGLAGVVPCGGECVAQGEGVSGDPPCEECRPTMPARATRPGKAGRASRGRCIEYPSDTPT